MSKHKKRSNGSVVTKEFLIGNCSPDENGCWIWQSSFMNNGYGAIWHNKKVTGAHRVAFELLKEAIQPGKHICHTCDNRKCINPDHLWQGTNYDNRMDSVSKGRNKTPPPLKGVDNPKSKLSKADVLKIRGSKLSAHALSKIYPASKTAIQRILNRVSYANVE